MRQRRRNAKTAEGKCAGSSRSSGIKKRHCRNENRSGKTDASRDMLGGKTDR